MKGSVYYGWNECSSFVRYAMQYIYFFVVVLFIFILYLFLTYLFESIAMMVMSEKLHYKWKIKAWIPLYNKYLLGEISGNKILGMMLAISSFLIIVLVSYFYFNQTTVILIIILFLTLFNFALDTVISHQIFKKTVPRICNVLTIFSILSLGLLRPIFILFLSNKINNSAN